MPALLVLAVIAGRKFGRQAAVENRPGTIETLGALLLAFDRIADGDLGGRMPTRVLRLPAMSRQRGFDPARDFGWIIHLAGDKFRVAARADQPWTAW